MELVIGIEEMYRNHPIPNLPNFKIVPWADQDTIQSADVYIQNNILGHRIWRLYHIASKHSTFNN